MYSRMIRRPNGKYEEFVLVLTRGETFTSSGQIATHSIILPDDVCELSRNIVQNQFHTCFITREYYEKIKESRRDI